MGLLSIFKRFEGQPARAAANPPVDGVQRARTLARQRLVGAVVLVIIGIIGFPLVFETQPRPIPVDIPIDLPRKDGAPALVMPPARTAPVVAPDPGVPAAAVAAAPNAVITESREEAGREVEVMAPPNPKFSGAGVPPNPDAKVDAKLPAVGDPAAQAKPDAKPEAKSPASGDGARARALLEGKAPASAAESGRFIVQVGAFADATSAHETRVKVEKLGLKTYTQVASTPAGNRIRVRVGPFGNRDEADRAMAKAKGAGLSAVVLTL